MAKHWSIFQNSWSPTLLVALVLSLMASQVHVQTGSDQENGVVKVAKSAAADTQKEPFDQLVVKTPVALQHVVQINLDTDLFALGRVAEEVAEEMNEWGDQFIISQSKTFRVLLERIISPNAP